MSIIPDLAGAGEFCAAAPTVIVDIAAARTIAIKLILIVVDLFFFSSIAPLLVIAKVAPLLQVRVLCGLVFGEDAGQEGYSPIRQKPS
jgi:hypothetical protein